MMMRTIIRVYLVASAAALLVGCNGFWLDTYWRSERYVLLAVDTRSQMSLSFDLEGGIAVNLVGATVFSIGADEKYIVLMQHPSKDPFGESFDRSITNYYLVVRTLSPSIEERMKGVRGPLSKEEFEKLATALSLPKFSKTFDDLK